MKNSLSDRARSWVDRLAPPDSAARRWLVRHAVAPARHVLGRAAVDVRRAVRLGRDPLVTGPRPRLLFVLHRAPGGVQETTRDLITALHPRFDCHVLQAGPDRLTLHRYTSFGEEPLGTSWLNQTWSHRWSRGEEHRRTYERILDRVDPHLVHVRHLLGHTDEFLEMCDHRGVPTVLSFHDYYMACPGVHLLDDTGAYCAGRCTPSRGQCRIVVPWLSDLPTLKEGYLESWRGRVRRLLPRIAAFVTTSEAARDVLVGVYPELAERDFRIIEHGRDFPRQRHLAGAPQPGCPVRIVFPGHLRHHKGSDLIRRIFEHDRRRGGRLELHFLGTTDEELRGIGVHHGPYPRTELAARLASIRPSFVGILSVWPETYCHTLTEAWAMGVPVLVTDLGAQGARVRDHGGGWLLSSEDPEHAHREILRIADDPDEYARELARAQLDPTRTVEWMADAYRRLYEDVFDRTDRPLSATLFS